MLKWAFALGLLVSSPAYAGPSMYTMFQITELEHDVCMEVAMQAMKDAKFTTNIEKDDRGNVFGERGPYTASIRCMSDHGVTYFVVAGIGKDAEKWIDLISEKFKEGSAKVSPQENE